LRKIIGIWYSSKIIDNWDIQLVITNHCHEEDANDMIAWLNPKWYDICQWWFHSIYIDIDIYWYIDIYLWFHFDSSILRKPFYKLNLTRIMRTQSFITFPIIWINLRINLRINWNIKILWRLTLKFSIELSVNFGSTKDLTLSNLTLSNLSKENYCTAKSVTKLFERIEIPQHATFSFEYWFNDSEQWLMDN
jgi:hypothetical protein